MSNVGRLVVTVVVGAIVVGATVAGVMYLKGGGADATRKEPPKQVVLQTPGRGLAGDQGTGEGSPATVQPVESGSASASGTAPAGAGHPAGAPAAGSGAGSAADAAGAGLAAAQAGRLVEAQRLLTEAVRKGVTGPQAAEVRKAIGDVADRILLAPAGPSGYPYVKTYEVAPRDSLTSVGKRHLVTPELVAKMNRLATDRINLGQKLRVLQGPIHVEIAKGRFELTAWCGDACIKAYPIAIGKEDTTPDGTFLVEKKIRNPPYQPQHKAKSAFRDPGAPDNPLGTRWIDLGNHYGIHGTIEPTSIGKEASEGCIRLLKKDVEELFDLVVPGVTKVTIKP